MRKEFLAVRISLTEKRLLKKEARRLGCPISDVVRWALRKELAEPVKTAPAAGAVGQGE